MKTPSRKIPPSSAPRKSSLWTWLIAAAFFGGFGWCIYSVYSRTNSLWPPIILIGCFIAVLIRSYRRFQRLKEERKEESICTFARSLPARSHDTMVVRAVYEELAKLVRVPIRPTDNLIKGLCIHHEDLDDVTLEIARRAGRSMENTQANPLFDQVVTVSDMVAFFEHQPKRTET